MPITPRYSVSTKNVLELRDLYGNSPNKIKVGEITSGIKGVNCRGVDIQIPDRLTVATFVKNGFSDELKLAGVYSSNAKIELQGKLLKFDVECNIGTGRWLTEMEITIGANTFTIQNNYDFESAYTGDIAYNNAQQSITPALQDFYGLIIKHPDFSKALNATK